jgi:hypothetical protein
MSCGKMIFKRLQIAGCPWLTPVILATQEAEIRRIMVQSQPRQIECETLSQKKKKKSQKSDILPGYKPSTAKKIGEAIQSAHPSTRVFHQPTLRGPCV